MLEPHVHIYLDRCFQRKFETEDPPLASTGRRSRQSLGLRYQYIHKLNHDNPSQHVTYRPFWAVDREFVHIYMELSDEDSKFLWNEFEL